jgi:hypothetical protein
LNSFARLDDHLAERPRDGSLLDFIHALEVVTMGWTLEQSLLTRATLGFRVGVP